ncbi:hypothetical protein BC941DRAFT_408626 [Chlamydoabsidia padenii]|nr:hypothetical protein BC941DRAFT_408626 [Chlamydoabsidia padenii]
MRPRLTPYLWAAIILVLIHPHSTHGCFLGIFGNDCHETTTPSSASATPTATLSGKPSGSSVPSLTSSVPSHSSLVSQSVLSSSPRPTSTSHSISTHSSSSSSLTTSSSTSSSSPSSSSSSSSSATASPTQTATSDNSSSSTGAIIGGVCGGVAVLILGFGYALYSRAQRKKRNEKAALYNDAFNKTPYQQQEPPMVTEDYANPYQQQGLDRPPPAMSVTEDLHYASPYQQQQQPYYPYQPTSPGMSNYGYESPYQPHQGYYSAATAPSVGYHDAGHSGTYYAPPMDTAAYYDHQQGYDQHYGNGSYINVAQAPPVMPHASSPTTIMASAPTYSAPHTYDDPPVPPKKDR